MRRRGGGGDGWGSCRLKASGYNVRTPANYDAGIAHPLLVVYAPAGANARQNEALTRLTSAATREGFIVAYASNRSMSVETVIKFSKLPAGVAGKWCIDLRRVYATGHSDGGTVSTAIAVLDETKGIAADIDAKRRLLFS